MTRFLIYNAWWADYVNHLLLTADRQRVVGHTLRPQRPSMLRQHQNVRPAVVLVEKQQQCLYASGSFLTLCTMCHWCCI